jgi:hypothetical protein
MWELMVAMEETGRTELAGFYYAQLVEIFMQKMMMRQQMGINPQIGIPQGLLEGQNGNKPGIAPTAQPSQSLGGGASGAQLSNPGPQTAPGTPRPGAQTQASRLSQIGLVGPGG